MKVSVLIVNWNSCAYLRKCLSSLIATSNELIDKIVVVDGASFDGCDRMCSTEFPSVEFVQSPLNVGFGRANNLGFERIDSDVLLLINPDTEVKPGAIQTLLRLLGDLPKVGILGPRLLNSDGSIQMSCVQSFPTALNQAFDSDYLRRCFPKSKMWGTFPALSSSRPVEVEVVSGACMLLFADVFRQVGGFSPEFFMYGEDLDLCAKVRRLGLSVFHVPAAQIIHHGGGSTTGEFKKYSTLMMKSSVCRVIRNHRGAAAAATYRLAIAVSALVRLLLLLPRILLSFRDPASPRIQPVRKWQSILRWSLGLETVSPPQTFSADPTLAS